LLMVLYVAVVSSHYNLWPKNVELANGKIVKVTALMEEMVAQELEDEPLLDYDEVLEMTAPVFWSRIGISLYIFAIVAWVAFMAVMWPAS